ncbi:hypothetical protein BD311DRAFT_755332 [Dichomitus squalens]|uniref:Uncharacterized protein n=1 Tax=Dichomitus squalens TaxID=114155 RepID=A0A4Q9MS81_9APHY|nr:hypothetical protein BD311DRAFT_755332 [Dichomitus squalens]
MRRRCFIWLVSRLTNRLFAGFETVLGVVFYTTPGTFLSRIVALTARRYGNCQSIWPFPSSWNGSTLDPASPPTSARVSRLQHASLAVSTSGKRTICIELSGAPARGILHPLSFRYLPCPQTP